jgi:hypothetical protein
LSDRRPSTATPPASAAQTGRDSVSWTGRDVAAIEPGLREEAVDDGRVLLHRREPGRPVVVECLRFIQRSKGASTVEITSWDAPGRTVTMRPYIFVGADCTGHKPFPIVVRPGRLGAAWISTPR